MNEVPVLFMYANGNVIKCVVFVRVLQSCYPSGPQVVELREEGDRVSYFAVKVVMCLCVVNNWYVNFTL